MNEIMMVSLGGVSGGVIAAIINYISMKRQIEFKEKKYISEINRENSIKHEEKLQDDKEYIIASILEIDANNSLTYNYIMSEQNYSNIEINNRYLEQTKKIREIIVKSRMSYKYILDNINDIHGISNRIWGLQQNYFGFSKGNKNNEKDLLNKLISLFNEMHIECNEILKKLW
jgi:hypothetical protein